MAKLRAVDDASFIPLSVQVYNRIRPLQQILHMHREDKLELPQRVGLGPPRHLVGEQTDDCFIAWFMPGDADTLDAVRPGCEGLFPIADNGAGDQYLVDPRQADPEIVYHLLETRERIALGVTLSRFLAAPRHPAQDEHG